MNTDLTTEQKDYATFLPALSGFYATFVGKQRREEYVEYKRIPQHFTNGVERLRIEGNGKITTGGEAAGDVSDGGGLGLSQGGSDGKILTFKSSDVAHGMTNSAETDTFAIFKKNDN